MDRKLAEAVDELFDRARLTPKTTAELTNELGKNVCWT